MKFTTRDKIEGQYVKPNEQEIENEKKAFSSFWAKIVADFKPQNNNAKKEEFIGS